MKTILIITMTPDGGGESTSTAIEVGETAQKHVLRSFNPERDMGVAAKVDMTKALCAALIQQMIDLRDVDGVSDATKRAASMGISLVEGAQMQCVKANFVQA